MAHLGFSEGKVTSRGLGKKVTQRGLWRSVSRESEGRSPPKADDIL